MANERNWNKWPNKIHLSHSQPVSQACINIVDDNNVHMISWQSSSNAIFHGLSFNENTLSLCLLWWYSTTQWNLGSHKYQMETRYACAEMLRRLTVCFFLEKGKRYQHYICLWIVCCLMFAEIGIFKIDLDIGNWTLSKVMFDIVNKFVCTHFFVIENDDFIEFLKWISLFSFSLH